MNKNPEINFGGPNSGLGLHLGQHVLSFIKEGKEVGRFWYEGDELNFKGDPGACFNIFMGTSIVKDFMENK